VFVLGIWNAYVLSCPALAVILVLALALAMALALPPPPLEPLHPPLPSPPWLLRIGCDFARLRPAPALLKLSDPNPVKGYAVVAGGANRTLLFDLIVEWRRKLPASAAVGGVAGASWGIDDGGIPSVLSFLRSTMRR